MPATFDAVFYIADVAAEQLVWSSDGKFIIFVHRKIENSKYWINFVILDTTKQIELSNIGFQLISDKYLILQPTFWLH